jgi:hypothetical protein
MSSYAGKRGLKKILESLSPLTPLFSEVTMGKDDGDVDDDDFVDDYYDEIIRHRAIARRTNWWMLFTSLSQREVALAATIESSMSEYLQILVALMITTNQLVTAIHMFRR